MADGVNIDWSLARPQQNLTDTYANAFQAGRQIAGQQIQPNALQVYMANPPAPMDPRLGAAEPQPAVQLQNRQQDATNQALTVQQAQAEVGGDTQGAMGYAAQRGATGDVMTLKAQIDALPEQERAAAAAQVQAHNEAFAHVLIGLKGVPPEQRLPMAQHIAQTSGLLDPAQITADDVSDAGINAHLATAISVEQYLSQVQAQMAETGRQARAGFARDPQDARTSGKLTPSTLMDLARPRASARLRHPRTSANPMLAQTARPGHGALARPAALPVRHVGPAE